MGGVSDTKWPGHLIAGTRAIWYEWLSSNRAAAVHFPRADLQSWLAFLLIVSYFCVRPESQTLGPGKGLNEGNLVHAAHFQCLLCASSWTSCDGNAAYVVAQASCLPYALRPPVSTVPAATVVFGPFLAWIIMTASLSPRLVPFQPLMVISDCVFCVPRLLKISSSSRCIYLLNAPYL